MTSRDARQMISDLTDWLEADADNLQLLDPAKVSVLRDHLDSRSGPKQGAEMAQWAAFNRVLHWINEQDEKLIAKGALYEAVMEMRPQSSRVANLISQAGAISRLEARPAPGEGEAIALCPADEGGLVRFEDHRTIAEILGAAILCLEAERDEALALMGRTGKAMMDSAAERRRLARELGRAKEIALDAIRAMPGAEPVTDTGRDNDVSYRARMARKDTLDVVLAHVGLAFDQAASGPMPAPEAAPAIALGLSDDRTDLGRFGHHPDPAIDFCIEVDCLESRLNQAELGIGKPGSEPETVEAVLADIERAMDFRVGGDQGAVDAKAALRAVEDRARRVQPNPAEEPAGPHV